MPVYQYKGFDKNGKPTQGLREADGVKSLRFVLRKEGILATDVEESIGGMVAAVPVYTVIRIILREYLTGSRFVQKLTDEMDEETEDPEPTAQL